MKTASCYSRDSALFSDNLTRTSTLDKVLRPVRRHGPGVPLEQNTFSDTCLHMRLERKYQVSCKNVTFWPGRLS